MESPAAATAAPSSAPQFRWGRELLRHLPPVRLTWIFLAALGGYESSYLLGLGLPSLVAIPAFATVVDLALQRARFRRLRFPDAALVTGLFLALLFPPTAPLLFAGAAAFAAVATRHALRFAGHPWLNPAASGVVVGALLFGLAPAWWVGIGPFGEVAMVALGLLLILRAPSSWRLPAVFLLSYGVLAVVQHVVTGATTDPRVLLLQAADPATLFFALFMVAEPRTAPGAPHQKVLYAGVVGTLAAFLPLVLPSLGILVSLLAGNLLAVVLRRAPSEAPTPSVRPAESRGARSSRAAPSVARTPRRTPRRWPVAYRIGVGILVVIVLGAVAGANPVTHAAAPLVQVTSPGGAGGGSGSGGSGGGGGVSASCQSDNPSIPSSELSTLHKMLGPSVILSYDANNGVVVFYDPVNHVTVTESDLYEDYGFAEFNGDDYAVSGCAP